MVKQSVPTPSAKRKAPAKDTPTSERSRPPKKLKSSNVVDTASTSATSKSKRAPQKNAEAGPSTQKSHSTASPTRISSRVPKPTMKKVASEAQTAKRKSRIFVEEPDSDSDGLPLHILPSAARKQASSTFPSKPEATPKRKVVHLGAIELSSGSEDNSRARPPRKRVKSSSKPSAQSEVIDLCSDDDVPSKEDTLANPRARKKSTAASNAGNKVTPPKDVLTPEEDTPKTISPQKKDIVSKNVAPIPEDQVVVIVLTDDEAETSTIRKQKSPVQDLGANNTLQAASLLTLDIVDTPKNPANTEVQKLPSPDNKPPVMDSFELAIPPHFLHPSPLYPLQKSIPLQA
ncbi:hypothetical protein CPB84DRAFT_1843331 [Gymnopilus junonius]|uniref:Uncharacterized protein n=1 Tax=Gymnopilus junonius TaxID=109634 RepID=A0A9P5NWQ4_GYMJU|nr:hypothetical protein CPB84DRAFT_1843331 [Gymnopilus junonius]